MFTGTSTHSQTADLMLHGLIPESREARNRDGGLPLLETGGSVLSKNTKFFVIHSRKAEIQSPFVILVGDIIVLV